MLMGQVCFFIVVYFCIFRGLYYGSYASPKELLLCFRVVILLLTIVTASIGYVLPWGQFSPFFY
jgi:ubiquinol-cytochrome c reductase cytochrome b subunit